MPAGAEMAGTDNRRVVFLDRDGVINEDSPAYIKSWAEFVFLPRSLDALGRLNQAGFQAIIITNQSGIDRGYFTPETLSHMHTQMVKQIQAHGGSITDIFFCPHTPEAQCDCRKPRTGLIRQAVQKYGLVVEQTVMIGDSTKDIECARNAGCGRHILVKTGNGKTALEKLQSHGIHPDFVAHDFYDAVEWIISTC